MKKMLQVLAVFSLIAAISFLFPACGGGGVEETEETEEVGGAPEGQLPIYQVGDTWSWDYDMMGETRTMTESVTGSEIVEGRDCYVINMAFDPVMSSTHDGEVYTVTRITYWADKLSGLIGDKQEMEVTGGGQTFITTETYVYDPWIELFPLEIGKTLETELTTSQTSHGVPMGEPVVSTEKYVVEGKEEITVAAGTFMCWKIVIYDGDGNVMVTIYYSDLVKSSVKMSSYDGVAMELKSYSVS
jgi:hypothetical protein